ncbi:hypothetical protein M3231_25200 [Neobacillus mesonae]|nr:hypothetical protein [Neobacillus mesonae]
MTKKRVRLTIALAIAALLAAAVIWRLFFMHYASFDKLVLDYIEEDEAVQFIEVTKMENNDEDWKKEKITDPQKIDEMMNQFSEMKLKASSDGENPFDGYQVLIMLDSGAYFDMNMYSDHLRVRNPRLNSSHKHNGGEFKITSDFDAEVIEGLF